MGVNPDSERDPRLSGRGERANKDRPPSTRDDRTCLPADRESPPSPQAEKAGFFNGHEPHEQLTETSGAKGVFAQLIDAFCQLPGVGPKTAQRYAFFLVKQAPDVGRRLADAITASRERLGFCPQCHNMAEQSASGLRCSICQQPRRDQGRIMVVEEPSVIHVVEKTGEYHGLYHVLQGAISPLDGVNPSHI
nr:recombination protein RecR [Nitrospirota bacterium]